MTRNPNLQKESCFIFISCGTRCENEWKNVVSKDKTAPLLQVLKNFIIFSFWDDSSYNCIHHLENCIMINEGPNDIAKYVFALDAKTLKPIETSQTKILRELCIEKKEKKNP